MSVEARREAMRMVFRCHAAGVAVVTAMPDDKPIGLTVASLSSVCLDPPLLSFNARSWSSVWRTLSRSNWMGVNILTDRQRDLAEFFSQPLSRQEVEPPARRFEWVEGVPVLSEVAARLLCRRVNLMVAGDHSIVIAEVIDGEVGRVGRPLVYHQQGYVTVSPAQEGI
jgi:flavin reductase (DIM6/NTAB) family NADH-FMN oxidoreductase RutF